MTVELPIPDGGPSQREAVARRRRPWLWAVIGVLAVLLGVYLVDTALAWGDVPRNTTVAGVAIGGLDEPAAAAALASAAAAWSAEPLQVTAGGQTFPVDTQQAGLSIDAEATLAGLTGVQWNPVARLSTLWETRALAPVVTSGPELDTRVAEIAAAVGTSRVDAGVRLEGITPVVVAPEDGRTVDESAAAAEIRKAWPGGGVVDLPMKVDPAVGTLAMAQEAASTVAAPAVSAPVTVTSGSRSAVLEPAQIAAALRFSTSAGGVAASLDADALSQAAPAVFAAFNTAPRNAEISIVAGTPVIVPSISGATLAPAALASAVFPVLTSPAPRTALVPVTEAPPARTTEQVQALGVTQQISTFTTYHSCCQPRVTNIQAIARILDGHLLMPGQTFDLNKVVGKRDKARGFVEAPMISEGEFRNSVGGGISQFATTLYNAAFFGGLRDDEHSPHSYYISRYPPGREATVSWTKPDLVFTNDSPYGVVIDTSYTSKSITVSLYSTKRYDIEAVAGPRRNVTTAPTKYITRKDDCNPASGAPGFTITNTRVFKENGVEVKRENFTWTYKPEPKMICGAPPA